MWVNLLKVTSVVAKVAAPDRCEGGGALLEAGVLSGLPQVALESLQTG